MAVKFKLNDNLGVHNKLVILPSGVEINLIKGVIYRTENKEDEAFIRKNAGENRDFEIVEEKEPVKKNGKK
jgi:hypothetical protein